MEFTLTLYLPPIGLRLTPKLFNILENLFSWIIDQQGTSPTIYYLDDFLTMGPAGDPTCFNNLNKMMDIAKYLEIPLTMEKLEGPSHSRHCS